MTDGAETERQAIEVDEGRRLPPDTVGLLEGICTTRAIRRYRAEPVPEPVLRDILFAASRAPSGSNRQPFRFLVLTDGPKAKAAKALIAEAAR
ncbi:MAG: nitroreductase family protein, partial [Acidimicrobiales bacterium]